MIIIKKLINRIGLMSLNQSEYLLNEENEPLQFSSIDKAKTYLRKNGYDELNDEKIEDSFIFVDSDKFEEKEA